MTTFAPTFTPRYKLHYHAAGLDHSVTIRGQRGETQTAVENRGDHLGDIFGGFNAQLADDAVYLFAEFAPTDSDVFVPARLPVIAPAGEVDTATMTLRDRITGTTFAGKSSSGRARFTLWGIKWLVGATPQVGNDYKITGSESAAVVAAVGQASSFFISAGSLPATFHNQATIKEWDNLVKLARRGIVA